MVLIKLVMLAPAFRNETKPTPPSYPGGLCPLIVSYIMGGGGYVPSELMRKYEGVKAQK